jgi:hypothetical protein
MGGAVKPGDGAALLASIGCGLGDEDAIRTGGSIGTTTPRRLYTVLISCARSSILA